MCDNLILLEIERGGRLQRRISVYKTRGSGHDEEVRMMTITEAGAARSDGGAAGRAGVEDFGMVADQARPLVGVALRERQPLGVRPCGQQHRVRLIIVGTEHVGAKRQLWPTQGLSNRR